MKLKFLNTAVAGLILSLSCLVNTANAGLITGTDIEIEAKSISYIEFVLTGVGEINWLLTGLPDGSEYYATKGYDYALFEGSFGNFGNILEHDTTKGLIKGLNETYNAGTYTFAIGILQMTETEARTGVASTPIDFTQLYNFSLSGEYLVGEPAVVDPKPVPAPTTIAIFALGMIGLASRRFKKQS